MKQQIYRYNYNDWTIEFGENYAYSIPIPPKPNDSEILYKDLPKSEQYWRRNETLDKIEQRCKAWCDKMNLNHSVQNLSRALTSEEKTEIESHLRKRIYGVFFMNNGKLEWMPPNMYFYLQSIRDNGHKGFRKSQGVFEFLDIYVRNNKEFLAWFVMKVRRVGGTDFICSMIINEMLLSTDNIVNGLMADSNEQMSKTWDITFKNMYETLPFYDTRENISKAIKELKFRSDKTNKKQLAYYIALKARGFDGKTTNNQFIDELMKCELDVNSMMESTQRACTKDGTMTRVGWVRSTSTVTEEVMNEKWIPYYKKYWDNASPYNNTNKCARLYVGGQYSINIDKYGEVDVESNMDYINKELAIRTDVKSRTSYMRAMSTSPEQVFQLQTKSSLLGNLTERLDNRLMEIKIAEKEYVRGYFQSPTGMPYSDIKFIPFEGDSYEEDDPRRRWSILNGYVGQTKYFTPNQVKKHHTGSYNYNKEYEHLLTFDAYTFDKVAKGGSNGGAVVGKLFNHSNSPFASDIPLAVYDYRPEKLVDFYKDMIYASIWFGCPMSFERQNQQPKIHIVDIYKQPLMLLKNVCSQGDFDYGEKPSKQFTIDGYNLIANDILVPESADLDLLSHHKFEVILEQIKAYNGENKSDLDVFSAWLVFKKISNVLRNIAQPSKLKSSFTITINN